MNWKILLKLKVVISIWGDNAKPDVTEELASMSSLDGTSSDKKFRRGWENTDTEELKWNLLRCADNW